MRDFENSQRFCSVQGMNGRLLILNNMSQVSLISSYLKLNNIDGKLWVGLRYRTINSSVILVDINDNVVEVNIVFEEGSSPAVDGQCISVSSKDGNVSFSREDCINSNPFICTITSIGQLT